MEINDYDYKKMIKDFEMLVRFENNNKKLRKKWKEENKKYQTSIEHMKEFREQSYLQKNSELLNQVEWVIFDEVHYINDNERGHVWEEILILLPKGIGIIMLSATVPNYMEFAQWVGDIKETKVYVQNTLKRVVPLQHLLQYKVPRQRWWWQGFH